MARALHLRPGSPFAPPRGIRRPAARGGTVSVYSEIAELAEELCEPHVHTERVPTWDKNRNKKYVVHRTTQPGLLAQLYQAAVDPVSTPGAATSHSKLQSRPPLAVAALSVYFDICAGAQRWVREFEMEVRVGPESNIRALIGMGARIPDGVLEELLSDL